MQRIMPIVAKTYPTVMRCFFSSSSCHETTESWSCAWPRSGCWPLRCSKHAGQVDWAAVDRLSRYGGSRIEDDVACRAGG